MQRCAILDDYQNVSQKLADWSGLQEDLSVTVFNEHIADPSALIDKLQPFEIVCLMRERTPFPREVIDALPNLKLIVTTGLRNAAIDIAAAAARGITVCGTTSAQHPTAELAFGLILDLARSISFESGRMRNGAPWQTTVGIDLMGKTLGILGLGKLGSRVAHYARAFDMKVLAWSQNLTPERCAEAGVTYASKDELLRQSDFISIHLVLSARTRGLLGASDLAQMKPTACLVNTSRGPIVDEAALIAALQKNQIAGAALDVYDVEPLPVDHPLRALPNALLTPHLGYVTEDNLRTFYTQTVEDVRAWLDGKPLRVIRSA